jgi:hypothetical protein
MVERKRLQGKTGQEILRCLKRRLCGLSDRLLVADHASGPGGRQTDDVPSAPAWALIPDRVHAVRWLWGDAAAPAVVNDMYC